MVIIWLVNKNWKNRSNEKRSNIIFTIIWKIKSYIFSSFDHKRETQAECLFNAGPPPTTPARHQINTRPMRRVYWAIALTVITTKQDIRPHNAGTTPIQRRRLWANTVPTLGECFVPAGTIISHIHTKGTCILTVQWRCFEPNWVNVGPPSVTLAHIQRGVKHKSVTQYWANVGSAS